MPRLRQPRRPHAPRLAGACGFTLVEGMIATVILAIAVLGIASLVNGSYDHNRSLQRQSRALSLARQLVEEVAAKPFAGPRTNGWPQGQTDRRQYDEVADYAGYTDQSATLTTLSGTPITPDDDESFSRSVEVAAIVPLTGIPSTDAARVRVTVTPARGAEVALEWLVTSADPAREQIP